MRRLYRLSQPFSIAWLLCAVAAGAPPPSREAPAEAPAKAPAEAPSGGARWLGAHLQRHPRLQRSNQTSEKGCKRLYICRIQILQLYSMRRYFELLWR
ncbi:hypothetical protein BDV95DRAFT_569219, partial [Massariosphaeria phaeospora]